MRRTNLDSPPTDMNGFALPMAIFLLLVAAGVAATTMALGSGERQIMDGDAVGNDAIILAETGLEQFAARQKDPGFLSATAVAFPDLVYDSSRHQFPAQGGYADLSVQRIRPELSETEPALYLIRSRGVQDQGGWPGAPRGVRVVTRLGRFLRGTLQVQSAFTSLGGLRKNGAAGTIDGSDGCAAKASVAGVAVPDSPGFTGSSAGVIGSPTIKSMGPTPADAAATVTIDWAGIVDGSAIIPDYVVPGDDWYAIDFTTWPVVYVDNPGAMYALPKRAGQQGTLIVRGDLDINGSNLWDGVILVGGALTSNGNHSVSGATMTGLNVLLGEAVPESSIGNGNKEFSYNSCNVANALSGQSRVYMMENTWFDSWALY